MTNRVLVFLILLLPLAFLNSCSVFKFAKIYSSSDKENGKLFGDVYKKSSTSYKIGELKSDWKRVNIDYGDIFFTNKDKNAAITVNSTCETSKVNYSLSALSGSLLIGIKEKKLIGRDVISIDDEEALLSVYNAGVEGDKLKIATVVFTKNECIYDFSYSNISNNFDLYYNDFIEFLEEFRVLEG
ncbi:MAG: hypothetical protein ACR2NW_06340 [Thermodesulfobacteriota bacterium]